MGSAEAIDWVYENRRLAFRSTVKEIPSNGDCFVLYATTGVTRTAQRGDPQILAVGVFESDTVEEPVTISGEPFPRQHHVRFETRFPVGRGVPFRPLVEEMEFIRKKRGWAAYVHKTLVELPNADYERLLRSVMRHGRT